MSTRTTEASRLRASLGELHGRHSRGDLVRRRYESQLADGTVALCRAVVQERLEDRERVVAEHHVVLGHLRLSQSVLAEPDQDAISLVLTDRRLIRLRTRLSRERPPTLDAADGTRIDETPLGAISSVRIRRQTRWGEAGAGVAILAFALLFRPALQVTGTLMAVLGVLGVLHALLFPTRWAEIAAGAPPGDEVRIHALGRRSGRAITRALRVLAATLPSSLPCTKGA